MLLDCVPAWDGNETWDGFIAFAWQGPAGERLLVAVNFAPHQSQCWVRLLFAEPSPAPAKYWLERSGLIDSAEVRLPMVEVSAELAALLDEEIERRRPQILRRA